MQSEATSDWIVGAMVAQFGWIGFVLTIFARDVEIFIFGASLLAFTVVFVGGIARRRLTRETGVHV